MPWMVFSQGAEPLLSGEELLSQRYPRMWTGGQGSHPNPAHTHRLVPASDQCADTQQTSVQTLSLCPCEMKPGLFPPEEVHVKEKWKIISLCLHRDCGGNRVQSEGKKALSGSLQLKAFTQDLGRALVNQQQK